MSDEETDNPGPASSVTVAECFQRHEKIDLALFGKDGMGGMVKIIGDIKSKVDALDKWRTDQETVTKTKGRDWRLLGFAVLGSVAAGLAMAAVNYFLTHLH